MPVGMSNKVEILRTILFTEEDFKTIQNPEDLPEFTKKDLEFMVEYKKIYELGEPQLRKFMDKLATEGSELDPNSINYYTATLKSGPFGNMVQDILVNPEQHTYWKPYPDSIGRNGDSSYSLVNTTIYPDHPVPLGTDNRTHGKLPFFMAANLSVAIDSVESIFRPSLHSSFTYEDSKRSIQKRYDLDGNGDLTKTSHGFTGVKDTTAYKVVLSAVKGITKAIDDFFNLEDLRMLSAVNFSIYYDRLHGLSATFTKGTQERLVNAGIISIGGGIGIGGGISINPLIEIVEPEEPLPSEPMEASNILLTDTDPETGATSGQILVNHTGDDQSGVVEDENGNTVGFTTTDGTLYGIDQYGGIFTEGRPITQEETQSLISQGLPVTQDGKIIPRELRTGEGPGADGSNSMSDDINVPPDSSGNPPSNSSKSGGSGSEFYSDASGEDFAKIFKLKKKITDNGLARIIDLDLFGIEFDSDERRERQIKLTNGRDYDKTFNLNTNHGQLGNLSDPNNVTSTGEVIPTNTDTAPIAGLGRSVDDSSPPIALGDGPPPTIDGPPNEIFDPSQTRGSDADPPVVPESEQPPPNAVPID